MCVIIDLLFSDLLFTFFFFFLQSEYLFVKADKLRQVANKYVRDLNEPFMDSNLQVKSSFVCICCGSILYCNHNFADAV